MVEDAVQLVVPPRLDSAAAKPTPHVELYVISEVLMVQTEPTADASLAAHARTEQVWNGDGRNDENNNSYDDQELDQRKSLLLVSHCRSLLRAFAVREPKSTGNTTAPPPEVTDWLFV